MWKKWAAEREEAERENRMRIKERRVRRCAAGQVSHRRRQTEGKRRKKEDVVSLVNGPPRCCRRHGNIKLTCKIDEMSRPKVPNCRTRYGQTWCRGALPPNPPLLLGQLQQIRPDTAYRRSRKSAALRRELVGSMTHESFAALQRCFIRGYRTDVDRAEWCPVAVKGVRET